MSHLYDESLYAEAQQLNKRTSREDLTTPTLIESLAFSRDAVRRLDDEYKDHIKPYKEAMKPFEADRSALKKVFEGASAKFEERLLAVFKRDKSLPEETNNGVRLTVALLPRLGVKKGYAWMEGATGVLVPTPNPTKKGEATLIEQKYLLPLDQCIDWKAVQAAQEAGEELPEWVDQFDQVSFRTKLPEVIE